MFKKPTAQSHKMRASKCTTIFFICEQHAPEEVVIPSFRVNISSALRTVDTCDRCSSNSSNSLSARSATILHPHISTQRPSEIDEQEKRTENHHFWSLPDTRQTCNLARIVSPWCVRPWRCFVLTSGGSSLLALSCYFRSFHTSRDFITSSRAAKAHLIPVFMNMPMFFPGDCDENQVNTTHDS